MLLAILRALPVRVHVRESELHGATDRRHRAARDRSPGSEQPAHNLFLRTQWPRSVVRTSLTSVVGFWHAWLSQT
jgi:hypothetical protein